MERNTNIAVLEHDKALGSIFVQSGFFTDTKKESEAVVKILAGREVGLKPIEAMTGIHIIKGKITFGANMMAAAVKKSEVYDYRVTKHTATECEIDFYQNNHGKTEKIGTSPFTMAEADKITRWDHKKNKEVKLSDGDQWKNYPKAMLFARALSAGVRYYCPDVFGHSPVYVPEEMGADVDEEGDVINITPEAEKPDKTPQKHTQTSDKPVTPRNPMPYLSGDDNPENEPETPDNELQIPPSIIEKVKDMTPREAFGEVTNYAIQGQGHLLRKLVVAYCPEYYECKMESWQIPESAIIVILKITTGLKFKKTEKTPKCNGANCDAKITEPEAEHHDGKCMGCFDGEKEA